MFYILQKRDTLTKVAIFIKSILTQNFRTVDDVELV